MAGAYKKPVVKATPAPVKPAAKPAPKPAAKAPAKGPTMPTKQKPAVGADKSAQKKYGSSSWNNGYTN